MKLHSLIVLMGLTLIGCQRMNPGLAPSMDQAQGVDGQSVEVPLAARRWQTLSVPNNAWPLMNDADGSLYFDAPSAPNSMNYLYTSSPSRELQGTLSVTLSAVGSGPWFASEPCSGPATVRPMIHSYGDDWSRADARWWSDEITFALEQGSTTLTVPIDAAQWSNVNGLLGSSSPAEFEAAMRNVSSVGITFGDRCFFGHGVYLGAGQGRVKVTRFEVS